MKVEDINFAKHINIKEDGNTIFMNNEQSVLNHLGSIHAGALYTLAETKSGMYLKELFPQYEGKVIAILREGQMKYKKPGINKVRANASVLKEDIQKFTNTFLKKSRGLITISIDLEDANSVRLSTGSFTWYIRSL